MNFRVAELPVFAKLTVSFFLFLLGLSYLAATSLIFLSIGKGEPPTPDDIQDKYGGKKVVIPPPPPGAPPARPPTKLEEKIAPALKDAATGKTLKKPGSMYRYLTSLDPDDSDVKKDVKRGDQYQKVISAWLDIAWDQAGGTRPEPPTSAPPAAKTAAELNLDQALADARTLSFEQFHASYVAVIMTDHCVRCHGPDVQEKNLRLDTLAGMKTYIALPARPKIDTPQTEPTVYTEGGMSPEKMALHIHIHAMTMAVMGFAAAVLMFFTGYPTWLKFLTVPWGLLGAILDIASWVLMKTVTVDHPELPFALLTIVGGGIFGSVLGLQITLVLLSMWFGPRGSAANMASHPERASPSK